MEDWSTAADHDLTCRVIVAYHVMAQHAVKVDSEAIGNQVEMLDIGVRRIVIHEYQDTTLLHPFGYLRGILGLNVMRMRILHRNIGRSNDVVLRSLEILRRRCGV